ncbi:MAG: RDD family protein [Actinobacteria bacterium]|nr:RDD family protein [Actinomycetota bacterium]
MSMPPPPPPGAVPPPPPPPGFQPYPATAYDASPQYAGFGSRLIGNILDSLLYGLLLSALSIPGFVLLRMALDDCYTIDDELFCPDGALNGGALAGAIVLFLAAVAITAVLYLKALGGTGQTWGRKIAGVKVVSKESGAPIGIGRALGRYLFAAFISSNVCLLGYLWMLWDKDKQTWHDKIVGSIVVKA